MASNPTFPRHDISAPDADGFAFEPFLFRQGSGILRVGAECDTGSASLGVTLIFFSDDGSIVGCVRTKFISAATADYDGGYTAAPEGGLDAWWPIGSAVGCRCKVDSVSAGSWSLCATA